MFGIHIHYEIITTIKLINTFTAHSYHLFYLLCVWWEHLRSPRGRAFKNWIFVTSSGCRNSYNVMHNQKHLDSIIIDIWILGLITLSQNLKTCAFVFIVFSAVCTWIFFMRMTLWDGFFLTYIMWFSHWSPENVLSVLESPKQCPALPPPWHTHPPLWSVRAAASSSELLPYSLQCSWPVSLRPVPLQDLSKPYMAPSLLQIPGSPYVLYIHTVSFHVNLWEVSHSPLVSFYPPLNCEWLESRNHALCIRSPEKLV